MALGAERGGFSHLPRPAARGLSPQHHRRSTIAAAPSPQHHRRSTIAGPLLLLSIIPAAALVGAGAVSGQWGLVKQGTERLLLDVAIIWATGALVVWMKQAFTHKRKPLLSFAFPTRKLQTKPRSMTSAAFLRL